MSTSWWEWEEERRDGRREDGRLQVVEAGRRHLRPVTHSFVTTTVLALTGALESSG